MLAKRTFWLAWFIPAALALVATACSSGGSARVERASSHATSTAPSTTADPQAADKAAVLAAYNGYWDTLHRAEGLPDGQPQQLPQLADYASDKALDAAVNAVETLIQHHRTVRGVISGAHPEVACISDARAVVKNRYVDAVDAFEANGQPVNSGASKPGPADTDELSVLTKRRSDDHWAVIERYISTSGSMPTQEQLCKG